MTANPASFLGEGGLKAGKREEEGAQELEFSWAKV